jgi:hypothetical protein
VPLILLIAAGGFVLFVLLEGAAQAQSSPSGAGSGGSGGTGALSSGAGVQTGGSCMITNDPGTWPSGDAIWSFARAIAYAEGANIAGSVPDRTNNPGDISDGGSQFGATSADGSNVTNFPDKHTGWQWLYNKLNNIANGSSTVYNPNMTIAQMASAWAGNSGAWANNVASRLGVSTSTQIGPLLGTTAGCCCSCCGSCYCPCNG